MKLDAIDLGALRDSEEEARCLQGAVSLGRASRRLFHRARVNMHQHLNTPPRIRNERNL